MSKKNNDIILGKKYRFGSKIGGGAFGDIYSGTVLSSGEPVAIKLEGVEAKRPVLAKEFKVYKTLAGTVGVPNAYYYGNEGDFNVMVMDMLGKRYM
jgi:predicted Ser/Thr protein kinase